MPNPDPVAVLAEPAQRQGMKGADVRRLRAGDQLHDPFPHQGRRAVREGHHQDPSRLHAGRHQASEAFGDHRRLPGPRARHHPGRLTLPP